MPFLRITVVFLLTLTLQGLCEEKPTKSEDTPKPSGPEAAKVLYQNNFEKAEVDKTPDEFLVLGGEFTVKKEGEDRFLELPGTPLETFGLLFGPTESDGLMAGVRILTT